MALALCSHELVMNVARRYLCCAKCGRCIMPMPMGRSGSQPASPPEVAPVTDDKFEDATVRTIPMRHCVRSPCLGYAYYKWHSADLTTTLIFCHAHAHEQLVHRGGFVERISP